MMKANGEICYAAGLSAVGPFLVAQTEEGICAILLGEDSLVADLKRRFPKARLVESGAEMQATVAEVARFVEAPGSGFALPLDALGTEFQAAVWNVLRSIPSGTTVSYTEVARRMGRPDAVRAVARAIGANPLAVVVPCHRVIGADGSMTGYHWGLDLKRRLLALERAPMAQPHLESLAGRS